MILRGNALKLPLADETVDLVVTSPPYFGLRSYQDGGEHYAGQIGDEATPTEFVDALVTATAEMVRVVKPSGSIFVNLGDKYSRGARPVAMPQNSVHAKAGKPRNLVARSGTGQGKTKGGIPEKSLLLIPQRYAIRCVDDLGLILRAEIIWSKPNGLPESVTDRVRRSHESWFHFTLSPRYYSAVDTIREWPTGQNGSPSRFGRIPRAAGIGWEGSPVPDTASSGAMDEPCSLTELPTNCGWDPSRMVCNLTTCAGAVAASTQHTSSPSPCARTCSAALSPSPGSTPPRHIVPTDTSTTKPTLWSSALPESVSVAHACEHGTVPATGLPGSSLGKLPGSVWTIPTEPLHVPEHLGVDHFAAYPTEWPRRIIQGWSPSGICTACGEGRRPAIDRGEAEWDGRSAKYGPTAHDPSSNNHGTGGSTLRQARRLTVTGEACACPEPTAPTRPATVLDPFGGTGTTALVAHALGRHAVHVDMSADYCRIATWRTTDPKQRAKAARRDYTPPPEQTTGQLDLLEGLGA